MELLKIIEMCQARVCGGSEYLWGCYGDNARHMEFADVTGNDYLCVIHDTKTFEVYELTICIPGQDQAFGWRNPAYEQAYLQECKEREVLPNNAYDNVDYEMVDEDTILSYAKDIGELYYDDLPIPEGN
jgi:hypothetical protein